MTDPKINLPQLRERATFENTIPAAEGHIEIPITSILALIDTAETAIELEQRILETMANAYHLNRLRQTLDRYQQ